MATPVTGHHVVEEIHPAHVGVVLGHHVRDGHLDGGSLLSAETLAVGAAVTAMFVAGHVDAFVVLPGNKCLVVTEEHLRGAPGLALVLQRLLLDDRDLVQAILANCASPCYAHLRQFVKQWERSEEIVHKDLAASLQLCLDKM